MSRKYSKFLTILLIVIIVAIVGLLAYLGYDYYSNSKATSDAASAVKQFTDDVGVATPDNGTAIQTPVNENTNTDIGTIDETQITNNTNSNTYTSPKTKPTYKGFNMVGTIEIPTIKLTYPILEKVTDKSLKTSVAVEWPQPDPVLNEVGNVVIAGHNYRNGTFFSNLKKLSKGDKIYITDLNRKRVAYSIYNITETTPTDTSAYNKDTDGKREITLKTCTDDSSKRIIIEAREE